MTSIGPNAPAEFDDMIVSDIARGLSRGFDEQYIGWVREGGAARFTEEAFENSRGLYGSLRRLDIEPTEFYETLPDRPEKEQAK